MTSLVAPSADGEAVSMPPHERSYLAPNGLTFMVGSRDETINRIPPLNMIGTTREVLVSGVAYGRLEGASTGKIQVGYHVGCAVDLGSALVGVTPDDLPFSESPLGTFNPNPVATINLSAGEVKEVVIREKKMVAGKVIYLGVRDFHIVVNSCTGPVTLRQFTYVLLESEDTDDSGAVFGEPTWM
ncbi:MspA family porin [Nocardia sp. XZ_19_385]|uniref:MspA family porin n=1 Tax=Nocardia sp. XZ_19_385 TaxID=2769488 RepID=UPI001E303939|nr:MspA family porin [Nocardia sp. XZ_19_385]